MSQHIMIDCETLGTAPSSVILTIGIAIFDPRSDGIIDTLELRPTIEEQTDVYGRTISDSTMEWWGKQSPDAIHEAMGDHGRIPYFDCMEQLQKFCWNREKVWANGSIFDVCLIEDALRQLEMSPPWNFWDVMDCRTIYNLTGVSLKDKKYDTKTTHKAVEDAVHQAKVVQDAYKKLVQAGFKHIK